MGKMQTTTRIARYTLSIGNKTNVVGQLHIYSHTFNTGRKLAPSLKNNCNTYQLFFKTTRI